jgi:hypothetical protein
MLQIAFQMGTSLPKVALSLSIRYFMDWLGNFVLDNLEW